MNRTNCTYEGRFDTIETAKRRSAVNTPTFLTTVPRVSRKAADGFYPIIPIPRQQLRQPRTVVQPARSRVGVLAYLTSEVTCA